jgi:dTDP-glucose 4,6-dehydratase
VRNFEFPEGNYSHVIHAATDASAKLNRENPLLMLHTIVEGTRHTLDFAMNCAARKFLLISSGAVYGKQPPEITHISEDYIGAPDPLDPQNAYGQGKRQAEHLCALYARDSSLEVKIARCFAFVGPYLPLDTHFAIGNFIRDAMHGGPIVIKGDGTPHRSYLYAADLAIWLWTILFRGKCCYPYNIGSENQITISDLAKTVARLFKPNIAIEIANKFKSAAPNERYVPLTQRAISGLRIRQTVDLIDSIKRTILWCSSQDRENQND